MKIYAFMADGTEETECLAVADVLVRGGADVKLVSVSGRHEIKSSHGITIVCDDVIDNVDLKDADALFLPGGMPGTTRLGQCKKLNDALLDANAANKRIAAICAAPSVLGKLGLLKGKTATCFPGFEDKLEGAKYTRTGVVTDGNVTTARGLGFAIDLGLELLALMTDKENSDRVKAAVQYNYND